VKDTVQNGQTLTQDLAARQHLLGLCHTSVGDCGIGEEKPLSVGKPVRYTRPGPEHGVRNGAGLRFNCVILPALNCASQLT